MNLAAASSAAVQTSFSLELEKERSSLDPAGEEGRRCKPTLLGLGQPGHSETEVETDPGGPGGGDSSQNLSGSRGRSGES